jgi:hypothetical protein
MEENMEIQGIIFRNELQFSPYELRALKEYFTYSMPSFSIWDECDEHPSGIAITSVGWASGWFMVAQAADFRWHILKFSKSNQKWYVLEQCVFNCFDLAVRHMIIENRVLNYCLNQ